MLGFVTPNRSRCTCADLDFGRSVSPCQYPHGEPCPECETGRVTMSGPVDRETGHLPMSCSSCSFTA